MGEQAGDLRFLVINRRSVKMFAALIAALWHWYLTAPAALKPMFLALVEALSRLRFGW